MAVMRTKTKVTLVVLGLLLILGPYQNCSLHQSEGRKQLETIMASHFEQNSCLPYISPNDVERIVSPDSLGGVTSKLVVKSGRKECQIRSTQAAYGLEFVVCNFTKDNRVSLPSSDLDTPLTVARGLLGADTTAEDLGGKAYYYANDDLIEMSLTTKTPVPPSEVHSVFGFAKDDGEQTRFYFVHTDYGLMCSWVIQSDVFSVADSPEREDATRIGTEIMKAVEGNCSTGKCPGISPIEP